MFSSVRGLLTTLLVPRPNSSAARYTPVSLLIACAMGVTATDLITKHLANLWLGAGAPPVHLLGNWVQLALVLNNKSAFGVSVGPYTWQLNLAFTMLAIVLSLACCEALAKLDGWAPIILGLIAGAAAGNLVSLITSRHAGVVDFVAVRNIAGQTLVFNMADVAAMIGLVLIIRTALTVTREIAKRNAPRATE